MCINALQRDTVLVTDIVGRVEAALKAFLKIKDGKIDGEWITLNEMIAMLGKRDIDPRVVENLDYMRGVRNRVIHDPRRELPDRALFEAYSREALPHIEAARTEKDLLEALIDKRTQALFDKLLGGMSLEEKLEQKTQALLEKLSGKGSTSL